MNKRLWKGVAGLAVAGMTLAAAGCGGTGGGSDSHTVTIGVLVPLSGGYQEAGETALAAVKVAAKQINDSGGIKALDGAKIKVVSADSTTDIQTQAATAASQLLRQNPDVIVGPPISSVLLPASTVTERAGVPMCTAAYADEITSRKYKYIFQVPPKGSDIGAYGVGALKSVADLVKPDGNKVAVFYNDNPANAATVGFADKLDSEGDFDVTLKEQFATGSTSLDPLASKIKNANPDILVPSATVSELSQILGTLSSIGLKNKPIFWPAGGSATFESYAKSLGSAVNGQFVVNLWDYDMKLSDEQNTLLKSANDEYVKETGYPFMGQLAGESYVCANAFIQAIEKAGSTDGKKVRQAMVDTTFDSGPASLMPPGKVDFDETGQNTAAVPIVSEWCNGLLGTVAPEQYAANEAKSPKDCGA